MLMSAYATLHFILLTFGLLITNCLILILVYQSKTLVPIHNQT